MLAFEPAPFQKVLSADIAGVEGCGQRVIVRLACGHSLTLRLSRHKDQKRMRCKQCKEIA